jgi:hypothetical protein
MSTSAPTEVTQAQIGNALRDEDPATRAVALRDLRSRQAEDALGTLPNVKDMLADPVASVRCEACATIAWFGDEALEAVGKLVDIAINDKEEPEVRSAAAKALPHIDPNDDFVFASVRDVADLGRIIQLLDGKTNEEQSFRKSLRHKKAYIELKPLPGYRRIQIKDIVCEVFGQCPHDEPKRDDGKTWRDTKDQNIRNWMANGKLPSIRVTRGLYDVEEKALEALLRVHNSTAKNSNPNV